MRSTSLLALSLVSYLYTHAHTSSYTRACKYVHMNEQLPHLVCACVCTYALLFHYATETSYDPEKDLKRQRKQKEKKIEEFQKAAKKKKKKESECITLMRSTNIPLMLDFGRSCNDYTYMLQCIGLCVLVVHLLVGGNNVC